MPGRAIPALQRIHFEKGLLDRVECVSLGEPLGSSDLCAVVGNRERQADDGPPTVEQHRARAALTVVAALLRRGHSEPISKRVQQGGAYLNNARIGDIKHTVTADALVGSQLMLVRGGKKELRLVRAV